MPIRFQHYTLLVDSAFRLASSRRALDSGLYRVEMETELMEGASFQAERWLFATIRPVDAQGRTRPGEIYEVTRAELTQILTCHASALQPPNTTHAAMQRRAAIQRHEALPRTDALAIERASNEGMVQYA